MHDACRCHCLTKTHKIIVETQRSCYGSAGDKCNTDIGCNLYNHYCRFKDCVELEEIVDTAKNDGHDVHKNDHHDKDDKDRSKGHIGLSPFGVFSFVIFVIVFMGCTFFTLYKRCIRNMLLRTNQTSPIVGQDDFVSTQIWNTSVHFQRTRGQVIMVDEQTPGVAQTNRTSINDPSTISEGNTRLGEPPKYSTIFPEGYQYNVNNDSPPPYQRL